MSKPVPPPTSAEQRQLDLMFTSGRNARKDGIAIKDCPFVNGSAAAREWKSGWRSVGTETETGI
jgi:hypothetical protein